jgi:hypothetical protein
VDIYISSTPFHAAGELVGDGGFHAESRRFTPIFQQKFNFHSMEKAIFDLASDGAQLGW